MAKIESHEFKTRFLNHLVSFLDSSNAAENKHSFKLYMYGQLGRYDKKKYKEAKASRPLKHLDINNTEDLEERFIEAFKLSLILLKSQGHSKISEELISRIKEKEGSIENFSVSKEIEKIKDSFRKLDLSSNLEEPLFLIYAKNSKDTWTRILEHDGDTKVELPAEEYRIQCIKSKRYVEEETNLEENSIIKFAFEQELEEIEKEENNSILQKINPFASS